MKAFRFIWLLALILTAPAFGQNAATFPTGGGSGSPGGSSGQLQYNNSGAFGGTSGWSTDGANALTGGVSSTLAVGGSLAASSIFTTNGNAKVVSGSFGLSGNISAPAWTTSGIRYVNPAATLTDTSSSGTVAAAYTDVWAGNTIAAASATTYTNYYGAYFLTPVAGTNVTMTNKYALGAGSLQVNGPADLNGGVSSSVLIGASATASGANSVTIGNSANTGTNTFSVAVGYGAISTQGGVAIGGQATTANNAKGIAIGQSATIGASTGFGVAIGQSATTTAANQFVSGSPSYPINDLYFGKGVTNATATAYTLHGTSGTGTDNAGADLKLAGGQGTGTGVGGAVTIQVAPPGSTGTSANALVDAVSIGTYGTLRLSRAFTIAAGANQLPAAGTVGRIARVTDGDSGLAWGVTAVNTGAGATPYLVYDNGTAWTVLGK